MLLNISGTIVDGSTPITSAPAQQPVSVPAGTDLTLALAVVRSNGTALDLTGYSLRIVVRTSPAPSAGQTIAQIPGTVADGPAGLATFDVPANTTRPLLGTYYYDVYITSPTVKRDEVVPGSAFEVTAAPGA